MRKGKEKCEILKAIRTYIADKYGVEYTPSECHHKGECQGTCPKCDAELEDLQEKLKAKGVTDISEDARLSDLVRNYLHQDYHVVPIPDEHLERTEGMPIYLQGDIAVVEEGQQPDLPTEGLEVPFTAPCEEKKLFMECCIAGISFHDIDDIWNELQVGTKLALVRHKDNAYDKNAVAVALIGDYGGNPDDFDFNFILGYIPRKCNKALASILDMGWQDMLETEICELKEHAPYSDRIHISIYIKNKKCIYEDSETDDRRLRMMIFEEEEAWELFSDELWRKGYTYFRWGGFPPWELDLPNKGDKVVFMYDDGEQYFMYLMQTIAIGEQSRPFLEDIEEQPIIDDCTTYILTNVVGPVVIENSELTLPENLLKDLYQPDKRISQSLTDKLMDIFIRHQYSSPDDL